MKRTRKKSGFSLLELLAAVTIMMILTGAAFQFLDTAQQRHRSETDFLDSFQGARLLLDQFVRDVQTAGYPPANLYASEALAELNADKIAQSAFAWSPSYPDAPCVPGACTVPGAYDLIVETDVDPENDNGVEWVRYRLNATTLWRGVATKSAGVDPAAATLAALLPFVEGVMNNPSAAEMAAIRAENPWMFPGGSPVPLFTYTYEAGMLANVKAIKEVNVTLIVQAARRDPKTRQLRLATLTGRARTINPR